MNAKYKIIVPFYNDYENFLSFVEIINSINLDEELFLIVDNGSNSNDIKLFYEKNINSNTGWSTIRSEENLGFGGGIVFGAMHLSSEYIAWMPGNLKVNPKDMIDMLKNLTLNGNLLVKCRRRNRPISDRFKTIVFGAIISILFQMKLDDVGGTPNIVNNDFFRRSEKLPNDFTFDSFVYYYHKKMKLPIHRPKISYKTRLYGTSHWQKGFKSETKLALQILMSKKNWDNTIEEMHFE